MATNVDKSHLTTCAPIKLEVFVGCESGLFKGVECNSGSWKNLNTLKEVERKNEIVGMFWGNKEQTQVAVGRLSRRVDFYDMQEETWYKSLQLGSESGVLKCVAPVNQQIVTGDANGLVQLWKDETEEASLKSGENLCCMGQRPDEPSIIATGGKESDSKIWDLRAPHTPIFSVKNVRNDWLDLRVPVWVRGVAFLPQSNKLVTCTAHHQVRLYDPNSKQRRPVMDIEYGDLPLIAMTTVPNGQQVIVGNSIGNIGLVDLRKGALVQSYKGSVGAVRCLQCHTTKGTLVSGGLDRYLRVYDIETHAMLHKVYLKSRLNCLLYRDEPFDSGVGKNDDDGGTAVEITDSDNMDNEDGDDDDDELWRSIEAASTAKTKRKTQDVKKMHKNRAKRKKSSAGL